MALQLVDLNSDVEYLAIDVSLIPYSFSVKLADKTYTFTVKYNDAGKFFTVDLLDVNGNVLARLSDMGARCSMSWKMSGFRYQSSFHLASLTQMYLR